MLHPIHTHLSHFKGEHTIDHLGIHLFQCFGNDCTISHHILQDIVGTIVLYNEVHILKKVSHLFPYHTQW
jgi:hypothetical protein